MADYVVKTKSKKLSKDAADRKAQGLKNTGTYSTVVVSKARKAPKKKTAAKAAPKRKAPAKRKTVKRRK